MTCRGRSPQENASRSRCSRLRLLRQTTTSINQCSPMRSTRQTPGLCHRLQNAMESAQLTVLQLVLPSSRHHRLYHRRRRLSRRRRRPWRRRPCRRPRRPCRRRPRLCRRRRGLCRRRSQRTRVNFLKNPHTSSPRCSRLLLLTRIQTLTSLALMALPLTLAQMIWPRTRHSTS